MISFLAFVIWNKGIVIGDRSAHAPSINFGQFGYFMAFSIFFVSLDLQTVTIRKLPHFLMDVRKNVFFFIAITLISLILIHYFSPEHPYLLADNRHYTFYIWKNIFRRFPNSRYFFTLGYIFAFWLIWNSLRQVQSILWCIFFFSCVLAVLVPTTLLEFRYYIIPFLFIKLHLGNNNGRFYFQLICYSVINLITIYIYLYHPFSWFDGQTAHFMW